MGEKRLVLIGFMGSGKSSCGRILSKWMRIPLIDTDKQIEQEAGKSVSRIFEEDGEERFRQLETETLQRLIEKKGSYIFSVGGGTPLRPENRELLKKLGTVIYLKASPESVWERVRGNTSRPLLQKENPKEEILSLMEARKDIYPLAAELEVETDHKAAREVAEEVRSLWEAKQRN